MLLAKIKNKIKSLQRALYRGAHKTHRNSLHIPQNGKFLLFFFLSYVPFSLFSLRRRRRFRVVFLVLSQPRARETEFVRHTGILSRLGYAVYFFLFTHENHEIFN